MFCRFTSIKMLKKFVLFMGLLCCTQNTAFASSAVVACYFNNWSIYRQGLGQFRVENIDPKLCTHIFYAFEGVTEDGTFVKRDDWADINLHEIEDIIALKENNPDLKVLVSIGGLRALSGAFSQVMKDATARMKLISNSLAFIRKYGFDGLDIVWEFPTSSDKESFARFIQEIHSTFKHHNLLVTAAVAFTGNTQEDTMINLDMISLLEYDFHGYHDKHTGSNSPLYSSPADTRDSAMNVNASVNHWISQGADPQKLLLGIPFYGKSFTLDNPRTTGLCSPANGIPPKGQYTQETGVLGYNEICVLQMDGGWSILWEDYQKVPYMFKGKTWISYDNVKSIQTKHYKWTAYNGHVEYQSQEVMRQRRRLGVTVTDRKKTRQWTSSVVDYQPCKNTKKLYHGNAFYFNSGGAFRLPYPFYNHWNVPAHQIQVEYALNHNLLGVSVWALGLDDFRGTCMGKENLLLKAINDVMTRS